MATKTKRQMARLIRVLKRNRNLKKAARKTYTKPAEETKISAEEVNAPAKVKAKKPVEEVQETTEEIQNNAEEEQNTSEEDQK